MKALTLTQPWASLIALGHKHVETRSWTTYQHYGGVIAIHAAKGFPRYAREFFAEERLAGRVPPLIPFSAIVAVARLADCCRTEQVGITDLERRLGDYSPGRWAFLLEEVVALAEPISCRGALGFWTVPTDIEEQVRKVLLRP